LRIRFLNSAAQNLLGISERLAIGREIVAIVRPADELVKLCERALQTGLPIGLREFETSAGGRALNLDCRAAPMENDRGLVLEIYDTERDKLVRREADLVAQQKLSRRIIRQLAHEVKNPLGGLRGAAQLLERQLPAPELTDYTRVIIDEADRLAALVDGLLQAGGAPKTEHLNLHEITEHVASLINAEKPAEVELIRDYDPSLPMVNVDRHQMIQALLNLAKNALQAVGDTGRIVFRTRALPNFNIGGQQHRLVLSAEVQDDGPGIADDLKETVFYPLVSDKSTGSGLGLTIAQDLVSYNGGLIEFESRPGETVFRIRIPVGQEPAALRARS